MIEQAITVTNEEIVLLAQFFIHKDYSVTKKDIVLDLLGKHYRGQIIRVRMLDGENFIFSGFQEYMLRVCDMLGISTNKIVFETHSVANVDPFKNEKLRLGIFLSAGRYLPAKFDNDRTDAKFVGTLLGRYNITRLRLAYELDNSFPADNYITYQPRPDFIQQDLRHFGELYQKEFEWLSNKRFDHDLTSTHHMGMIDWTASCSNYGNVWNKYQIEVVSETDAISDYWYTEKTANCLATGKPFVLLSGQGSLQRLRDMGFKTFDDVLDESYDLARNPYDRIQSIVKSLTEVYRSNNRFDSIKKLYEIASVNVINYQHFVSA